MKFLTLTPSKANVAAISTFLFILLIVAGCGGESEAGDPTGEHEPVATETSEPPSEPVAADPEPTPNEPMENILTVGTLSTDEPVAARALRDAVFHLMGQTVVVSGYPGQMGPSTIGQSISLGNEPTGNYYEDRKIECSFSEPPGGSARANDLVVVRGTVGNPSTAGELVVKLADCELVSVGEPAPADASSIQDVFDQQLGWIDQRVRIVGRFNGQTTSRLSSGDQIEVRVQDTGAEGLAEQVARCRLSPGGSVPEATSVDRDGVVFEGTISPLQNWPASPPYVLLEECSIVNR